MTAYKHLLFFLLISLLLSNDMHSQSYLDSNYTYKELNDVISDVKSSTSSSKVDFGKLAPLYFLLGEYEAKSFNKISAAIENYNISKDYYKIFNDSAMIARVDRAIGEVYLQSGFYSESLMAFAESEKYYKGIEDTEMLARLNYDISRVFKEKVDPEKELRYLQNAMKFNDIAKDSLLTIEFVLQKVKSYEVLNELDSAVILSIEALRLSKEADCRECMSRSLYHLGYLNRIRTEYDKAEKHLLKANEFSTKTPYSELRKTIYKELSLTYERKDDYKNAYKFNEMYADLNDSILNKDRVESLNNAALKYETQEQKTRNAVLQKEQELAEEQNTQQRNAMYILTAGVFMLLALLYYIVNFYRTRMRAEEIISGQNAEISQQKIRELEDNIKISSMQSMLEGQEIERERISKDLHDSLGGLLSTIKLQFDSVKAARKDINDLKEYRSANKMLDTAVEEVRSISQNLQPGSLMKLGLVPALKDLFNRFDEDIYPEIDFQHYNVPESIPSMIALSIYRVIQELLHNTIKHAKATEILIQINVEGDELVIQFEDDGKGFDPKNLKRKGMGLENIKSRINYLKGQISIQSEKGEGTSTLIHVRYK